jgi:hypothetical protein
LPRLFSDFQKFMSTEAVGTGEGNRLQPEFGDVSLGLDMDMYWLLRFIAEKEEPVASMSVYGGHSIARIVDAGP